MRFHKKFGPDRFCPYDIYWIQTNKQIDKQSIYIEDIQKSKCVRICFLVEFYFSLVRNITSKIEDDKSMKYLELSHQNN